MTEEADEDYITYAGWVDLQTERFKLNVLDRNLSKYLLISNLDTATDKDLRVRVLFHIELIICTNGCASRPPDRLEMF